MELILKEDGLYTRCPDCQARLIVPLTIGLGELRDHARSGQLSSDMIDGDRMTDVLELHVGLNPEIHPTFTKSGLGKAHRAPCRHLRCMVMRVALRLANLASGNRVGL